MSGPTPISELLTSLIAFLLKVLVAIVIIVIIVITAAIAQGSRPIQNTLGGLSHGNRNLSTRST